ncbi:MAG: hypothetical protein HY846_06465 [Nitrosomonadales bacterium]|nr:hypothetical protein [Nitrosomonadales bacterium]
MKLRKFAFTLAAAALLPAFAHAGTDAVADSFDRAFINPAFINASRAKPDLVAASFEQAFGNASLVNAYRTKSDQVLASFERGMHHDPVTMDTMLARADLKDFLSSSLRLGNNAIVASFERDLLGNAVVTPVTHMRDTVLASFERDLHWMPAVSAVTVR